MGEETVEERGRKTEEQRTERSELARGRRAGCDGKRSRTHEGGRRPETGETGERKPGKMFIYQIKIRFYSRHGLIIMCGTG